MNFKQVNDQAAIDLVAVWVATNATRYVRVIENVQGDFEFWNGKDFVSKHPSFEVAARHAESVVPFKMKVA